MFPKQAQRNVTKGYQGVEKAFAEYIDKRKLNLTPEQKDSLRLYMYATVVAETGNFSPRSEPANKTNTLTIPPEYAGPSDVIQSNYNKYSYKNGNEGLKDAQTYHGRGYVQLTGKGKYQHYGAAAGIHDLVANPGKAAEPDTAAKLLVAYVMEERSRILKALDKGDMINARAVVNGGGHHHIPNGMRHFQHAYTQGLEAIDPTLKDRVLEALKNPGGA